MRVSPIVIAAALVIAGPSGAQDAATARADELVKHAREAIGAGRYLEPDMLLHDAAFGPDGTVQNDDAYGIWEQTHTAVDDWFPQPGHARDDDLSPADLVSLDHATLADAIAEIVRRARKTRIVILNENHSDSRDRAFGLEVARALRPLGYDTLAVETLSNDAREVPAANKMELIRTRGSILRFDGYYTRDPVFADFLRQALALGYRPVAYEATRYEAGLSPDAQIASRERQQADNLFRSTLGGRPQAKVLIYVGFHHVMEHPARGSSGNENRWMAARLKVLSGIDPLTIDQTTLRLPDPPAQTGDDPMTRALLPRLDGRSVVAIRDGQPLVVGEYAGKIDLQVIHPPAMVVDGRPGWLFAMGRERLPIPATLMPSTGTRLIQAFAAADDPKRAIPLDQVLVAAGSPAPPLLVPSGLKVRFDHEDSLPREPDTKP